LAECHLAQEVETGVSQADPHLLSTTHIEDLADTPTREEEIERSVLAQDQKEDRVQHEEVHLQQEVSVATETPVTDIMKQTTIVTDTSTTEKGTTLKTGTPVNKVIGGQPEIVTNTEKTGEKRLKDTKLLPQLNPAATEPNLYSHMKGTVNIFV